MTITAQVAVNAPTGGFTRPTRGNHTNPKIVVVCDPPTADAVRAGFPMPISALQLFAKVAFPAGIVKEDILFIGLCPPIPNSILKSDSRRWAHVEPNVEEIWSRIRELAPRCIVPMGKEASRVVLGRPVAITKARGKALRHEEGFVILPMLAPSMILRVPDHEPTFIADIQTLARLKQDNYEIVEQTDELIDYQWREDISDIVALNPERISLDTETTGLRWHDPSVEVITVQICHAPGKVVVCPVDPIYWPEWKGRPRARAKLISQIKSLVENPRIKKIGHNLKFDVHMMRKLGIQTVNWSDDTQLKAFAVDENMMEKSLDECVRRWVLPMAGYADEFNQNTDKSNMRAVPRDQMLQYAAGDADATIRLDDVLTPLLNGDEQQRRVYRMVQMPAMRAFVDSVEPNGMLVDQERLQVFGDEVRDWLTSAYPGLIGRVPVAVRRAHLAAGKELKFSRPDFVRDTLFTADGFGLTPVVFTEGTRDLDNPEERIASTSSKDHLPFFADPTTPGGKFVLDLIDFQKTTKLEGSFIGKREDNNGLWQYISSSGKIYPSYMLHRTVTGRTASADPNGQNFPKRGRWAKPYQSIFTASPGFKIVNCDLSQIELRIAAWTANERTMLQVYRDGGDIHTTTAKAVSGLSEVQWNALSREEKKLLRFKAKACNFGFIYGMGARKFRAFAKTDYGVEYTERESYQTRDAFFALYSGLDRWHGDVRRFVKANGYIRSLHGAVRHLPTVWSNDEAIRASAERQAINSPVQRFGSDLGLMSMSRFAAQADPELFRIIGFVHDALVMEVRDGYEREGIEALLWAMQSNPLRQWFGITSPIPIIAEADIGLTGGNMLEFADLPPVDERPEWFRNLNFDAVTPTMPDWWDTSLDEEWEHLVLTN